MVKENVHDIYKNQAPGVYFAFAGKTEGHAIDPVNYARGVTGKWTPPTDLFKINKAHSNMMGLTSNLGILYMVGRNSGLADSFMFWCKYDIHNRWSPIKSVPFRTSAPPSVAIWGNSMVVLFNEFGELKFASYYLDDGHWSTATSIAKSSLGGSIAHYRGGIYAVFVDEKTNKVFWKINYGSLWSSPMVTADTAVTDAAPSLEVFNGSLVMSYKEAGSSNIWVCFLDTSGSNLKWKEPVCLTDINGVKSKFAPGLTVFKGLQDQHTLYLSFKGDNDTINTCTYNGKEWSKPSVAVKGVTGAFATGSVPQLLLSPPPPSGKL